MGAVQCLSGGMSLPMIGKRLGHTQAQTKLRYAHLLDNPLRVGIQHAEQIVRSCQTVNITKRT